MLGIPAARQTLIERIATSVAPLAQARRSLPADEFVRQFYHGVAEEDLASTQRGPRGRRARPPRFGSVRKPAQPLVRVSQPRRGARRLDVAHTVVEVVHRGHAVPGRLARHGADAGGPHDPLDGAPGARRASRPQRPPASSSCRATAPTGSTRRESWQHIEIDRIGDAAAPRELEQKHPARRSTTCARRRRLAHDAPAGRRGRAARSARQPPRGQPNEVREAKALLEWMADNHFTFLGYREYELRRGRAEDLLEPVPRHRPRHPARATRPQAEPTVLTGEMRERARHPSCCIITKANSISTVHRSTYLDYVGVKTFDAHGRVTGEQRFLGLFTSSAYNRSPREIPLLRHKIAARRRALRPRSREPRRQGASCTCSRPIRATSCSRPACRDLIRIVRGIVNLYERQRVRVFLRRDPFRRFYSCLIYVPRDRYNTQVRERIEAVIKRAAATRTAIESQVQLSESALARLHMLIRVPADSRAARRRRRARDADHGDGAHLERPAARRADRDARRARRPPARRRVTRNAFPAAYEEDVSIARSRSTTSAARRSRRRRRPDRDAPALRSDGERRESSTCACSARPRRSRCRRRCRSWRTWASWC